MIGVCRTSLIECARVKLTFEHFAYCVVCQFPTYIMYSEVYFLNELKPFISKSSKVLKIQQLFFNEYESVVYFTAQKIPPREFDPRPPIESF